MRCFLGNNVEYSVAFCSGHDTEDFGRVLHGAPLFLFFARRKKRCGSEQCKNDKRDRRKGGYAGIAACREMPLLERPAEQALL